MGPAARRLQPYATLMLHPTHSGSRNALIYPIRACRPFPTRSLQEWSGGLERGRRFKDPHAVFGTLQASQSRISFRHRRHLDAPPDQKVEQCVISCRDGAPQTGLPRATWIEASQITRHIEKALRIQTGCSGESQYSSSLASLSSSDFSSNRTYGRRSSPRW